MTDLTKRLANLSPEQRALLERLLNQEQPARKDAQITARRGEVEQLPLSFEQQRLWFIDQLASGSPAYNSPVAVRLKGPLNREALEQSLNEIIRRHEVLRTTFTTHNGQPVQFIQPQVDLALSSRDLSNLPTNEREESAFTLACEEARRPFDLAHGPVIRAQLLRLGAEEHILTLTLHHIAVDAWSIGIIFRELATLYDAYRHGQTSPLPALTIQYADYALWQRQRLEGTGMDELLAYWRTHLTNLPALKIPADHPRPSSLSQQGAKITLTLPQALKESLQAIGRQEQATLFITMLAAFQILLARYSGQEDLVVGTSVAGRNSGELDNLVGFFVNMLVLRTDFSGSPSFREALRRVHEECLQAYAHQDLPFERLVEELHPERDPTRTPLFQVLFQSIEVAGETTSFPGLEMEPFTISTGTSKFDLLLSLREPEQGLVVEVEYNSALFEAETIARMLNHYQALLEGLVANPRQSIQDLPLLTTEERQLMLETWNQTKTAFPDHLCLHELFEERVQRQPQATALIHAGDGLTYNELNSRANQLAHYLQGLGVGPETVVGLCIERSVEMVVGILGILKAGGAYAPLDPTYPKERLAFMLGETNAPVVLTQQRLLADLPEIPGQVVRLDSDWQRIAQKNNTNPVSGVGPAQLAYIIYTSGSTGTPKGIAIQHGGVVNNLIDLNRRFAVGPEDRVLSLSSLNFDMCVYEVLGTLEAGGTLILPSPEATKDPAGWFELLTRHRVTVWNSAPALLELFASYCEQAGITDPLPLRLALQGGDWVPVTLPDRLKTLAPDIQFIVMGGATEASIHSIIYPVEESDPTWRSIPYGRPMANQQAYILDTNHHPVPVGVPGELHLGGVGLARGYLYRPDLTAEKFIPHPFSQKPGERLYRTGDLARYGPDGTIELLGRMDFLVKIRGLRIELGEIEATLRKHPDVQEVVVLVKEDTAGDKQLVAYVVAPDRQPAIAELRAFLAGKLPDYMQPKTYLFLDRLPLSPNGKLDRRALPEFEQTPGPDRENLVVPRDALETRLAETWSAILGGEQIGIDDNFFELGGDSFKAIRTARACSDTLALIDFFKHPTIRELAAHLRQKQDHSTQLLYELTRTVTTPELSLVCVPYGGGNVVSYQTLANNLPANYRLYSVALPGHDFAQREEPLLPLPEVAKMCVEEIIQTVRNEPLALYGQCAGVALTIEIARQLEARHITLQAIYLGAALPDQNPLRSIEFEKGITDEEMLEWLRWLGGFEDVLDAQEIQHIIKAVRHDLLNAASYYKQAYASPWTRLKTPIWCIIGSEDGATRNYETGFKEWNYFSESVELLVLPGAKHYFVKYNANELARMISAV